VWVWEDYADRSSLRGVRRGVGGRYFVERGANDTNTPTEPPPESGRPRELRPIEQVREQRAGVRAAAERVERAAASPAHGRTREWCEALAERLSELAAALRHHVEVTEARDGLFTEVIAAAPRLAHATDDLRRDHREIEAAIERAAAKLASSASPDQTTVDDASDATLDLMKRISHHRHLGAELVYDAYQVDIEAAD
jgi:Hemerythrin HHE cation binding domain